MRKRRVALGSGLLTLLLLAPYGALAQPARSTDPADLKDARTLLDELS